ncbi:MAG: PQQ-binding-like beta-propeller repeat protein [Bifidobacteriaceae bacterium]|jgi:outer membrane protein assembly factor BamB|nr:PQQ-binding-like beta-propeller repeat protein [Bifidobacteriaceae bacterium]
MPDQPQVPPASRELASGPLDAPNRAGSTGIAAKIPRAKVMPVGDAVARAAAVAHAAAAVRGAAAGRERIAHDPADQTFRPVAAVEPAPPLPHRAPARDHAAPSAPAPPARREAVPRPPAEDQATRWAEPRAIAPMPQELMPGQSAPPRAPQRQEAAPRFEPMTHHPSPIQEMPAELMPSAKPRRPAAGSPPARQSLGAVPLGRIELRDPAEQPQGRRGLVQRMGAGVLVSLLVIVLALGAAATLWILHGQNGRRAEALAPDFGHAPALGEPFDIAEAGLESAEVFLLREPALGGLSQAGEVGLVVVSARRAGRTQVMAVDTAAGAVKWELDLADLTGDPKAAPQKISLAGGGVVAIEVASAGEEGNMVVTVGAGGEVLSRRPGVGLLGAAASLVALRHGEQVAVAAAADLTKNKWTAEAPATEAVPVLAALNGQVWVATKAGYANGKTGAQSGFGADASADVLYAVLPDGTVVRVSGGAGPTRVMGVDTANGQDLWEVSVDFASPPLLAHGGEWLFAAADGEVKCVRPKDGKVFWARPADRFVGVVGSTAFVAAENGQVSALKARTGGLKYQFKTERLGPGRPPVALGAKTLYLYADGVLRAYPLEKDAKELWSVDVPGAQGADEALFLAGGRLWLRVGDELRPIG